MGTINDRQYEWSFGNTSDGRNHAQCGYTMLAPGCHAAHGFDCLW